MSAFLPSNHAKMTCLPLDVCPVSTPRHPGAALSALMTLGKPAGGACAAAVLAQAHSPASARHTTIFIARPPLSFEHPSVLREARHRPLVQVRGLQLRHEIFRHLVAMGIRIDAIDPSRVEPEDLCLDVRRERAVAEPLDQHLGHREATESLDLPLR